MCPMVWPRESLRHDKKHSWTRSGGQQHSAQLRAPLPSKKKQTSVLPVMFLMPPSLSRQSHRGDSQNGIYESSYQKSKTSELQTTTTGPHPMEHRCNMANLMSCTSTAKDDEDPCRKRIIMFYISSISRPRHKHWSFILKKKQNKKKTTDHSY